MLTLPKAIINLLLPFEVIFHPATFRKAQLMLIGAILAPGKRTVTSVLRVMGLGHQANFALYHHVLNRASWSSLKVSGVLLTMLIRYLHIGSGPLVFGMDDTIERRWGKRISAKGIYRDAVRSSKSHLVKASGLRWISLMWLAPVPWAKRHWALPVLTVLAPSERYYQKLSKTHKKLTDWARQIIIQLRRWLPERDIVIVIVIVADSSYAVLDLLHFCQSLAVIFTTRLRMDAALFEPAPPREPGTMGRPRIKGQRLPSLKHLLFHPQTEWTQVSVVWYDRSIRVLEITSDTALWYHPGKAPVPIRWVLIRDPQGELEPQALLCTDPCVDPTQIIEWFVLRWQLEVTFEEVRAHLGVETQRQWSDLAIARTTPALFGLFSWITLAAHLLQTNHLAPARSAAWYVKSLPTFSDSIALVRKHLWLASDTFCLSPAEHDTIKISKPMFDRLIDSLCYAA